VGDGDDATGTEFIHDETESPMIDADDDGSQTVDGGKEGDQSDDDGEDANGRSDPLEDLAATVSDDDREHSSTPDFDDLFDRHDAADIDGDRLWERLEADRTEESSGAGESAAGDGSSGKDGSVGEDGSSGTNDTTETADSSGTGESSDSAEPVVRSGWLSGKYGRSRSARTARAASTSPSHPMSTVLATEPISSPSRRCRRSGLRTVRSSSRTKRSKTGTDDAARVKWCLLRAQFVAIHHAVLRRLRFDDESPRRPHGLYERRLRGLERT